MRKYFVTGFYMLIVGGILLLGGIVMGANRSVVWDHGFKVAQVENETYPLDDFKNIYVEDRDTNVTVKLGDRYKIHVDGDKSQTPKYKIKDGTLTVSGVNRKGHIGVDVFGREQVTITIPMNKTLDNVNVRLADGNIRINDVTINHLIKSTKDMDYDSNLYLSNTTVNNLDKVNLYNATLGIRNSKVNNMNLVASAHSDINTSNSTVTSSDISLDNSELSVKESNLDSMKASGTHSKVAIAKTTMMNKNDLKMYGTSKFTGSNLTVDGMDLSLEKGVVRYFDKSYGTSYQNKIDATNLLDIKASKGSITIK